MAANLDSAEMSHYVPRPKIDLESYARRIGFVILVFRGVVLIALTLTTILLGIVQWKLVIFPLIGLGLSLGASLFLTFKDHSHRALHLIFASIDVSFLLAYLYASSLALQIPLEIALSSPAAWLVFIYLVVGVIRLQFVEVACSGLLFSIGWLGIAAVMPTAHHPVDIAHAAEHFAEAGRVNDVVRIAIIFIVTAALSFATWQSKKSLLKAIRETAAREHLSNHFPRAILERLLGDRERTPGLAHAKAAIIFVDICGFTAIAEEASGLDVGDLLTGFRTRIHGVVSRHSGVIDKFLGDGALIVFGLPDAHPSDAARALACVVDLRDELVLWAANIEVAGAAKLRFGIGCHYGEVLVGLLGDDEREEFTVVGDTVNVAARLQQLANAEGGGTVVSEDAAMAAGLRFQDYDLGSATVPLRGRRGTIRTVSLRGAVELRFSPGPFT